MKELHELKQKLMDELKEKAREISRKPRMSDGDLDTINKLVKSIDRICEIVEKDDDQGSYSERGMFSGDIEYGRAYSNRGRDRMGRYTRNGYSREGDYSMDDGLVKQLEEKMRMEQDPMTKDAIKRCIGAMRG